MLLDVGIDIEDPSFSLIEEYSPSLMKIRAMTGQGIAILSDEYTVIGDSRINFPCLAQGPDDARATACSVDMALLKAESATEPRHRAFDFVIRQLNKQEEIRERSAAQS